VVYRFDVGGLENGVVNLINAMAPDRYRHGVVALTECNPAFARRLGRQGVPLISMRKPAGHGLRLYPAFARLMRELHPAIVHTRNLAALEMAVPAWLGGVGVRIHGEHGWDSADPQGASRKLRLVRRAYAPFVHQFVGLSGHIADYLVRGVGIAPVRVTRICNGVDSARFTAADPRATLVDMPFGHREEWIFGTVGRLQEIKDQLTLVRAFAKICASGEEVRRRARLVIAGDGPLRAAVENEIRASGLANAIWLAGERDDVPQLMRALDCFVLPSKAEGISNTILEAMATALPVIATAVGGNPELVANDETGWLVAPEDPDAMARAMLASIGSPQQSREFGMAGRRRVEAQFSLEAMVRQYVELYDRLLADHRTRPAAQRLRDASR
jgi:sugar transferase (PEP-CTERM/EpsH1 system associated)